MANPFNMSDYLETQVLEMVFENGVFAAPATVYLALFTSLDPTTDGNTYVEVSTVGTAYARQIISFAAAAGGTTSNPAILDFPMATANYGTVTAWGIFDNVAAGNMLYWGLVDTPQTININTQFEVAANGCQVSIIGQVSTYLANKILEHTLRGNAYARPANVYTALLTAFTSDAVYTELVDANYSRKVSAFSVPANTATSCSNSADINFGAMVNTYTANYVAVLDALTGGNLLVRGPLTTPVVVPAGKPFKFPAGSLVLVAD